MAKFMRNTLLFAKLETVYGTDPTPTGGANAILCRAVTPQPVSAEFVDRALIRPYFGASEQINAATHSECEFEVELAGAGAAGDVPKWGSLLRACGFAETVTADTDVKYAPVTNGIESITLYYYLDGLLHKMTGARGNVSFDLSAKGIPVMKFKFTGLYSNPTDVTMPTADYSGFTQPLAVNDTNTPTWSLHGVTSNLQSLSLDMANNVVFRALIGQESVYITDRKPTGSFSFELGSVATKDWWTTIRNAVTAPLTITHGTVAGNIIQLDAPKAQIVSPQYQDSDGVAMLNGSLSLVPDDGNDEIVITVK